MNHTGSLKRLCDIDPAKKVPAHRRFARTPIPHQDHCVQVAGYKSIRTTCKPHHRQVTTCRRGLRPPPQAGKENATGILPYFRLGIVLASRWVEPPASRPGKTRSLGSKKADTPGRPHKWNYPTELTSGTVAHHGYKIPHRDSTGAASSLQQKVPAHHRFAHAPIPHQDYTVVNATSTNLQVNA